MKRETPFKVGDVVRVTREAMECWAFASFGSEPLTITDIRDNGQLYVAGHKLHLYDDELVLDKFLTAANEAIEGSCPRK